MMNCEYATSALRRDSYKINQVYKSIPCSYQSKFFVKVTAEINRKVLQQNKTLLPFCRFFICESFRPHDVNYWYSERIMMKFMSYATIVVTYNCVSVASSSQVRARASRFFKPFWMSQKIKKIQAWAMY